MSTHGVRVTLLVWKPVNADAPGDVAAGWPQVLQVRDGAGPWQAPSVVLRGGELVMGAAERVAHALGLTLPNVHRVLAVDQRPAARGRPGEVVLVVDGGWVAGEDAEVTGGGADSCAHAGRHRRRWASADALADDRELVVALGAAVAKLPPFVLG
ncbi:hypothetical protein AB0F42_12750 [Streptomyces buecherae]|uniref:hypothetical protein n=1 Tax=Streptomyces buecherae TaxID=2763006 RepID=UPI0033D006B4